MSDQPQNKILPAAYALALAVKRHLAVRTRVRAFLTFANRRRWGWRAVSNFYQDCRWGGYCGGTMKSMYEHLGATATQSTDYAQLAAIFGGGLAPINDDDVLVDLGCGKGRVINYWLGLGRGKKIVGIELDASIAAKTRKRLKKFTGVEIIAGSVLDRLPADGTLFYMFNPFEQGVMLQLKNSLDALAKTRDPAAPAIRLVYYYCRHADVFARDPAWRVRELSTGDHHRAVLIERVNHPVFMDQAADGAPALIASR